MYDHKLSMIACGLFEWKRICNCSCSWCWWNCWPLLLNPSFMIM